MFESFEVFKAVQRQRNVSILASPLRGRGITAAKRVAERAQGEVSLATQRSIDGTRIIGADSYASRRVSFRDLEFRGCDTLTAARSLVGGGRRVSVLSFASPTRPGGSWDRAAPTQEEDLVRSSDLLSCLQWSPAAYEFYRENDRAIDPIFADVLLSSPSVPFLRSDDSGYDDTIELDVITCAAPIASSTKAVGLDQQIRQAIARRIQLVLRSAAALDTGALVLGAWGCGEFGNSPEVIAAEINTSFERSCNPDIDTLVVAVPPHFDSGVNYEAFRSVFDSHSI